MNIAVGIAVAASTEFREDVVAFLINMNNSYAEMKLINPDETRMHIDVSDIYMPSYMLEGYTLCSYNRTNFYVLYS